MINPFLKRLMKDKKEDIFHSSAYGQAQNSSAMGVASSVSFNNRMRIDRNRQNVRGYGDSRIVSDARSNGPRPATFDKTAASTSKTASTPATTPALQARKNPGISR